MIALLMTYASLDVTELRGTTQADYLISIEGDLQLLDGDRLVLAEPSFPVVELARSLVQWLDEPARGDFGFESMSLEERGAVSIRRSGAKWSFCSELDPGTASAAVTWHEAERCVRAFVAQVDADLRGLDVDPDDIIRR